MGKEGFISFSYIDVLLWQWKVSDWISSIKKLIELWYVIYLDP